MGMRRSFLLAAVAVAAPLAALFSAHGCSSEQPFESVCLWVADPNNCYRKFHEDSVANGKDCKPFGDPSPATLGGPTGSANGSFGKREMLDICLIGGGGQIVVDPPIDLTMFPPSLSADPITRKFTILLPDGSECGNATYTSPHGFSFTINAPPDAGASASTSSSSSSSGSSDAGPPEAYGTYTSFISPGRDAFDVTCPSGESHHFDLVEVAGPTELDGGGAAVSTCPLYTKIVPSASFVIDPGGVGVDGAVSFTIVWPPDTVAYPGPATLMTGSPVVPLEVTYFNCTIPAALPLCTNGMQDQSETDVDCGGTESNPGCPARCGDGQHCIIDCDCDPALVCTVKMGVRVCGTPAGAVPARDCNQFIICADGKKDGAESDVDCGGPDCSARCVDGQGCQLDSDCQSAHCFAGVCETPNCNDGMKNLGEIDVDCGGPCPPCANGKICTANIDCSSGNCVNKLCETSTCTDNAKNGLETDVDCGGIACPKCDNLKACLVNADCVNGACVANVCLFPSCSDLVKDGTETDVDCGGTCPIACADGKLCGTSNDCASSLCGAATVTAGVTITQCFPVSCLNDAGPNLCGNGTCPLCDDGLSCTKNSDCLHNGCVGPDGGQSCQTPTCTDGAIDGTETDVDCGGNACPVCDPGKQCLLDTDCGGVNKKCINKVCQ